ncbi:MAG: hypothetical protein HQL88_02165 [Magnetococcales bacterium]|nr:hypothetical protein [Magnetococcales bacterium]
MNKNAHWVALISAVGFSLAATAYGVEPPPAKKECKSDKKCDEQQKAATIKK